MKRVLILLIPMFGILYWYAYLTEGEYYRTYSPDGQYSVYSAAYNFELYLPIPFHKYSDMSGQVYLYDEVEKKIINSGYIEMTSLAVDIRWEEDRAHFIGGDFLSFDLPRKIDFSEKSRK